MELKNVGEMVVGAVVTVLLVIALCLVVPGFGDFLLSMDASAWASWAQAWCLIATVIVTMHIAIRQERKAQEFREEDRRGAEARTLAIALDAARNVATTVEDFKRRISSEAFNAIMPSQQVFDVQKLEAALEEVGDCLRLQMPADAIHELLSLQTHGRAIIKWVSGEKKNNSFSSDLLGLALTDSIGAIDNFKKLLKVRRVEPGAERIDVILARRDAGSSHAPGSRQH